MRRVEVGFTLVEVLVAISILGMSLVLIFSLFSQGLTVLNVDKAYSTAVILAKSKMDEVDPLEELEEGEEEGMYSEVYSWRRELVERPEPRGVLLERQTVSYHVRVTVSWQEGLRQRRVALETLRTRVRTERGRGGL